jgi:hypothetical protein
MPATLTDKLRKLIGFGGSTTLTSGIASNATSGSVNSFSGYPTDTATDLVIDRVDANGNATPNSREVMTVTVSGNNFTTDATRRALDSTSALAHNSSAVVENNFTAKQWNDHIDAHLAIQNQDGTLITSIVTTPKLKPTTGFAKGALGGDHTTTSTSLVDLVTVLTYTAGATNERLFVDCQGCFLVSANAGVVTLTASGTGVTTQLSSKDRTASTSGTNFVLHGVFDVTATNTITIKIQGNIITSGTLTVFDSNEAASLNWYLKYVAYGNS